MSTSLHAPAPFIERPRPAPSRYWVERRVPVGEVRIQPGDGQLAELRTSGRINDADHLQDTLEAASAALAPGGRFVCQAETTGLRKERFRRRFPRPLAFPLYVLDFAVHRAAPKLPGTSRLYEWALRGRRRAISRTELLGRLIAAGFKIERAEFRRGLLAVEAVKAGPSTRPDNPSWGLLFRMRRVGRGGREIGVYKLRTMHPYAEFLQEYVYETLALDTSGKFKDDFRITSWGRVFRRFWIDELPMLLNLLMRDLKVVGVRPLSRHYLSLYPEHVREKRLRVRPGLIPPFYADLPDGFDGVVASELRYLEAYEKSPLWTDLRYFARAFYNIVIRRARSA